MLSCGIGLVFAVILLVVFGVQLYSARRKPQGV
jgi:hypothetical protein